MRLQKPKDALKTTKKQRRAKLSRFKDTARRCFGKAKSTGFGVGKTVFCLNCNNYPLNGAQLRDGQWHCKDCGSDNVMLKSRDINDKED